MEDRFDIPGGPKAAGAARDTVARVVQHVPEHLADDVRLLVSELVTNSVRHAGMSESEDVHILLSCRDDVIRVEVSDTGPGFDAPSRPSPRPDRAGGWGLVFLDRISDRWGVDSVPRGTRVWFEIDVRAPVPDGLRLPLRRIPVDLRATSGEDGDGLNGRRTPVPA